MPIALQLRYRFILAASFSLILTGCDGGGTSSSNGADNNGDQTPTTYTLSGKVVNGPLSNAIVEIYDLDGQLIETTLTTELGDYSVELTVPGPYRILAKEGQLDEEPYLGELSGYCAVPDACHATPFTTAQVELMSALDVSPEEAKANLGNQLGFHFDPFIEEDQEPTNLDMALLRTTLDDGAGLSLWVSDLVQWVQDAALDIPPGILAYPDIPPYEPDTLCTDFAIDVDTPHYLVATHAEMVTALEDPDDKANGELIIGITADMNSGFEESGDYWFYDGDHALTLIGWKTDGTRPVIDSGTKSRHILYRSSEDLTLSGLTFQNGRSGSSPSGYPQRTDGGSLRSTHFGATIFIHDSHFNSNAAGSESLILSYVGGAISSNGPVIINNSRFYNNLANRWGGAVHSDSRASVCFSEFEANRQVNTGTGHYTGGMGGSAISVWWNEGLKVYESSFIDNSSQGAFGGALYSRMKAVSHSFPPAGEIKVANSTFTGNTSTNGAAVAMSNGEVKTLGDPYISGGDIYFYDSEIIANETETGSILRADEANIHIVNSHFESNDGDAPEGILVATEVHFKDTTFSDNAVPVVTAEMIDLGGNAFVGNRHPSLGPEGRIAYYHQGAIRAIDPNGQNMETLATVDYFEPSPSWSPEGSDIAYVDGTFGATDVWRLSAGPGQKTRLTNNPDTSSEHTAWSYQNEIAYSRRNYSVGLTPFLIYVTTPSGGEGTQISGAVAAQDHERFPAWSPDGEELVFANRVDVVDSGSNRLPVLYRMDRDGSSRAELWPTEGAVAPAWSPDGTRIAYQLDNAIWVRDLTGGSAQQIIAGSNPSWSPDGQWLVYDHDGMIYRLSMADVSAEPLPVTEGSQPDWSN